MEGGPEEEPAAGSKDLEPTPAWTPGAGPYQEASGCPRLSLSEGFLKNRD